jgi:hypothetical protein
MGKDIVLIELRCREICRRGIGRQACIEADIAKRRGDQRRRDRFLGGHRRGGRHRPKWLVIAVARRQSRRWQTR